MGPPPPELPELPLPPADHGLWFYHDQFRFPVSPDSRDQRPEQPVPVPWHRPFRFALVHGELLVKSEDPQPCRPIEPREDYKIEKLDDGDQKQCFHRGSMEFSHPKVQRNQSGRGFRGARAGFNQSRHPSSRQNLALVC